MRRACIAVLLIAACGHASHSPAAQHTAPPTPVVPVAVPAAPDAGAPVAVQDGCHFVAAAGHAAGGQISVLGLATDGQFTMPGICPAQACTAGLTVALPNRGGWKAGMYDVLIATEAGTLTCHNQLTMPGPWTPPASCAHQKELSLECDAPAPPTLGPIMIGGAPALVQVRIVRDGAVLADQTLHPSYSNRRWDGFECAAECRSAKGSIDVK